LLFFLYFYFKKLFKIKIKKKQQRFFVKKQHQKVTNT